MKKLKTKVLAGLLFLFTIILLLGALGSRFMYHLSHNTEAVIRDNYHSVEYAFTMIKSLDEIYLLHTEKASLPPNAVTEKENQYLELFRQNLDAESKNITEISESELVAETSKKFAELFDLLKVIREQKPVGSDNSIRFSDQYHSLRETIEGIYIVNMQAIKQKDELAAHSATNASFYMLLIAVSTAFIALIFIVYFPKSFLRPIYELIAKIQAIAKGDYDQKLSFTASGELQVLSVEFNTMAEKLKEFKNANLYKLLIEKKRMEAVVNSLNDAIILVDEKMLVVSANKVALELTGLKEPDIIGKYAPDIAMRNDLFREIIKGVVSLDSNEKPEDTLQIVYDQKDSFFQKDIREIKLEEHGHIEDIGHAFILKNITSFEERDTAKTNLIATVSHELKTPLSSINLSIKLLEDNRLGDLNDSQKKILITVKQQTARLSKMVNELLDFSQAESGNIKLSMEKVKPEDIVDYAITALMIMAAEKKVDLDTQINGDLPYVKADIEKTVWVLSNLISNAIRYTPENGSITMKCDEDKDFVRFSVIDHGPGIAKDNLGKVFDKFVQIGNNPKGRGLGLTIAKEFVISQGGDIWVESEVGVGSVFTFKLLKYKA